MSALEHMAQRPCSMARGQNTWQCEHQHSQCASSHGKAAWFSEASHPPSQGNDRRSADAAANNRPTQCESDSNAYSALCVWIIWHVSVQAANTPARRKHDKESPVCPLRLRKTVKIPMHTWGPDSKLAALQESDHRPGRSASAGRI